MSQFVFSAHPNFLSRRMLILYRLATFSTDHLPWVEAFWFQSTFLSSPANSNRRSLVTFFNKFLIPVWVILIARVILAPNWPIHQEDEGCNYVQEEARKSESDVASSNLKKCCQIRLRSIGKEDEICRTSSAVAAICDAPPSLKFLWGRDREKFGL